MGNDARFRMNALGSAPDDVSRLPLERLAELSLLRLRQSAVLERAAKSLLYAEKWRGARIRPEEIKTYEEFAKIPFVTGREIITAINENPIEEVLCSDDVVHWFSTTGSTGNPKWIPYSRKDIELYLGIRDRCYDIVPSLSGLKCVAVSSPAPFIENALSAFERIHGMATNARREGLDVCISQVNHEEPINFGLDLKPNFIASSPSFASRFAEMVEEKAPEVARHRFMERKSLRNLLAYIVTRVKRIRPRDLSRYRWGLFGGEPLDPYRKILAKSFGLEPYEIYGLTEFICPAVECRMHEGMHLWMDACVPEVIPEAALEKESRNDSHVPKAIPLWKAEPGLRGEYVVTTFGEALPLIRYRSGDLIQVVSTQPCRCGITHPRFKVPRRSDTTLCLGLVRFPAKQLEEKLLAETPFGKAQRWRLRIAREGYRVRMIIHLEPGGEIAERGLFLKHILGKLEELEILRIGIENGVVTEPLVLLEDKIPDGGHPVAGAGRVVYEDEE